MVPPAPAARIGTIVTRDHAPAARVLAQSLARHHPELRLAVLVVDSDAAPLHPAREGFDVLQPDDAGVDEAELHRLATIYDPFELCCALKPRLLAHLLSEGADVALYLDADIEIFSRLDELIALSAAHPLLLTRHIDDPPPRSWLGLELALLECGAYNAGFVSVSPRAGRFLDWWSDRLRAHCLRRLPLFVDQGWLGLAASFFEHAVVRDPGCNVAWWNLFARTLTRDGESDYRVNGKPLRFFHYTFFDPARPDQLYDPRRVFAHARPISLDEQPAARELCRQYAERLVTAGYWQDREIPYGFATTGDGTALTPVIRRLYRQALLAQDDDSDELPDPFTPQGAERFRRWLSSPPSNSGSIPRYLTAVHAERIDLQSAFPDPEGESREAFLEWARIRAAAEGVAPASLVAELEQPDAVDSGAPASDIVERPGTYR